MICLFLALLELVKVQAISLQQGELFGEIDIAKERDMDEAMASAESIDKMSRNTSKSRREEMDENEVIQGTEETVPRRWSPKKRCPSDAEH